MGIKIFQKNLGKGKTASILAVQEFLEKSFDIAILQEPYKPEDLIWKNDGVAMVRTSGDRLCTLVGKGHVFHVLHKDDSIIGGEIQWNGKPLNIINVYCPLRRE